MKVLEKHGRSIKLSLKRTACETSRNRYRWKSSNIVFRPKLTPMAHYDARFKWLTSIESFFSHHSLILFQDISGGKSIFNL